MYCTVQDLVNQVSEAVLIELTDDERTGPATLAEAGTVIENRLHKAITDATNEINGYCQARYPIPFSPVPGFINKLSVDIALYNLFSRRGYDEQTQDKAIIDRYRAAVKTLENIAKGIISLGAASPPAQAADVFKLHSDPRKFSRDKLGGF